MWNCDGVHVLLAQNLTAGEAPDLRTSGFADGVQAVRGGVDSGQREHLAGLAALTLTPAGRGGLAPAPCGEQ